MTSPRGQFIEGARITAPVQLGSFPFAVICGVTAVSVGLDPLSAQGMSFFMFAGASQLVALQLIDAGAPTLVVILSAFIVNLRFLMYSASLAPHFQHLPWRWRIPLAHITTDQGYAVCIRQFHSDDPPRDKHWFYLGSGMLMWVAWQTGTLLGILLGRGIPPEWSLDFAIPLTFLAIVVPALRDRAAVAAFVASACVAVAAMGLPLNLGLMLAAFTGIAVGMLSEARA